MKTNIKNLSLSELQEQCKELGVEGFRAMQLKKWIYQADINSFEEMTNIKKEFRKSLEETFEISRLKIVEKQISVDGTIKYLLELSDGKRIETVFIPSEKRTTLCVSSQVGCAMDCQFCLTATMGLVRNLSVFEIVEQVTTVLRDLRKEGDAGGGGPPPAHSPVFGTRTDGGGTCGRTRFPKVITNLVFMGMGEPLANTKNLYSALEILLDPDCFNFSRQHITVSTSGLAPQIEKFGDQTPVKLAISLNATTDEVRDKIMPINKKFPLKVLFDACRKMHLPKRNRITFEYVMLHGVNDTLEDAKRLNQILSSLKAKINLLPFNEFPGSPFKRPPDDWVLKFQKILLDKGYVAVIRKSRGRDILGACGQLATQSTSQ